MSKSNLTLVEWVLVGVLGFAAVALLAWLETWVIYWGWNMVVPSHSITMWQAFAVVAVLSTVGRWFKSSGGSK